MINWRNRIFENLKKLVNDSTVDFRITNDDKLVQDKTVYFQLLSNSELESDLENTEENAENILIQIETYTKSLEDGYKLFSKITSAMKQMFFSKDTGIELLANIDTNYKRLVARFSRVVGSGDEIYKV